MRAGARAESDVVPISGQRIDKWLWCARLLKTRTLAAKLANSGGVRLTRAAETNRIIKASALVRPGDRLAFMIGTRLRIVEIAATGLRRGPASEARLLYIDQSPAPSAAPRTGAGSAARAPGAGRPTKKERRQIERVRTGDNE